MLPPTTSPLAIFTSTSPSTSSNRTSPEPLRKSSDPIRPVVPRSAEPVSHDTRVPSGTVTSTRSSFPRQPNRLPRSLCSIVRRCSSARASSNTMWRSSGSRSPVMESWVVVVSSALRRIEPAGMRISSATSPRWEMTVPWSCSFLWFVPLCGCRRLALGETGDPVAHASLTLVLLLCCCSNPRVTARVSHEFVEMPSRVACSSTRVLTLSGSRSVIRAVPPSSSTVGGSGGAGSSPARIRWTSRPESRDVDPTRRQLLAQLLRRLAERVQHPELQRGLQGAGQAVGDGQRRLVRPGDGLEVRPNGFQVRGQVHAAQPSRPVRGSGRRVDRPARRRFERSSASRSRSFTRSHASSSRIPRPIGATSCATLHRLMSPCRLV